MKPTRKELKIVKFLLAEEKRLRQAHQSMKKQKLPRKGSGEQGELTRDYVLTRLTELPAQIHLMATVTEAVVDTLGGWGKFKALLDGK